MIYGYVLAVYFYLHAALGVLVYPSNIHTDTEICCLKYLGISIVEEDSGPNGVTIEFDLQWDGNPNIVLDIKTRVGVVIPVQVMYKSSLGCLWALILNLNSPS